MKFCMLMTNGFEEAEALCPMDILVRGGCEVDLYSLSDKPITGRSGATLTHLKHIETLDCTQYDGVILPGGPEWVEIEASQLVQAAVKHFIDNHKYVCAICAAPTILGRQGYLKGKNYTCFESMNEDFGGTFHKTYVVVDDHLITACSAAASIDFGLAILETSCGKEACVNVKDSIYYHFK